MREKTRPNFVPIWILEDLWGRYHVIFWMENIKGMEIRKQRNISVIQKRNLGQNIVFLPLLTLEFLQPNYVSSWVG